MSRDWLRILSLGDDQATPIREAIPPNLADYFLSLTRLQALKAQLDPINMSTELRPSVTDDGHSPKDLAYQPFQDIQAPTSAKAAAMAESDTPADEEELQPPSDFTIHFPSYLPTPPFIHIQGVPNFRDIGGYSCPPPPSVRSRMPSDSLSTAKYMVRRNLLFRCAHPTQLTPLGASTLRQLGITDFFDLRSQTEIDKLANVPPKSHPFNNTSSAEEQLDTSDGYVIIPGIHRTFSPVYKHEDYSPVALARKLGWYTTSPAADKDYSEGFVNAYRDIATHAAKTGSYLTILKQVLRSLRSRSERPVSSTANLDGILGHHKRNASENEPKDGGIVFHCTAGKDRTGVLGAVILRLLGVDVETVAWEYAVTEPGLGSWRDLFIDRISKTGLGGGGARPSTDGQGNQGSQGVSRSEAARIVGSRAGNIREFLKSVMDGELGGVEKYLTEMVGLNEEELEVLKEKLVVEVANEAEVVRPVGIEGWSLEGGMDVDREREKEGST